MKFVKGIFFSTLFLLYPYLIYKSIESGVSWIAPVIFSLIFIKQAIQANRDSQRAFKLGIAVLLLFGAYYLQSITAKALPIFIQLMLMYVFGRTLLKDNAPCLIERMVRLQYPEFPDYVSPYLINLTRLWTLFFAVNVIACLVLAIWSTDYWWAIYNGIIIYLMIVILMVGEYIYRLFKFPEFEIPDMKSSFKSMMTNGRKIWMDDQS